MTAPADATESVPAIQMIDATLTSLLNPNRVVAEEVNWTVSRGDYWVIGGLHGTGKSDFISAAGGLLLPTRGKYLLFGKEISFGFERELVETRVRLGLVFDGGRLLNNLTLAQNVALPLQYHLHPPHEELAERVRHLLETVELLPMADHYPAGISRNHQQRVGLARAMALKPEVLLLDTPLNGLDPSDASWWVNLIDSLAAGHPALDGRPIAIVVTADDFRPWRGHARQFAVLHHRRLRTIRQDPEQTLTDETLMREIVGKGTE